MNVSLVVVCHSCRDRTDATCTLDGRDITEHAAERHCPAGRYQLGLGDKVASILHRTKIGPACKRLRAKVTSKPCGCKKRQQWLNQLSSCG